MPTGWNNALKQSLRRPTFFVVLLVLLVSAIGINAATTAMKLYFKKEALPLRAKEGLGALPTQLGPWVAIPEVHTINPDMAHELGTDKYVFRTYVDTSAIYNGGPITNRQEILGLESLPPEERARKIGDWRTKNLNAVVNLAVTYYTGKADTVPHVPDRCMVADGFQPTEYKVLTWGLGDYAPGAARTVPVRFIDFEDQTERGVRQNRCVTYFFHANGEYLDDPLAVRRKLQDLFQRYGYFAKIEVMTLLPQRPGALEDDPQRLGDRKQASASVQRFLMAALPEVEKILPDWNNRPKQ
jgi:hypothetical protein